MGLTTKTYSFYATDLNDVKYKILYDKAVILKDFKNRISQKVCSDPLYYISLKKFDWVALFREKLSGCNNQDINNAICDVFTCYDNKRDAFNRKADTKIQKNIEIIYYKVNTKDNVKGSPKSITVNLHHTSFTKIVSYLVKYYRPNLIEYLHKTDGKVPELLEFHSTILNYLDKFGDRLTDLIKFKQQNIIDSVFNHPIEFQSLSYTSCTEQKQNIITKNPRTSSIYNCYITLPGQPVKGGKITLPVKLSRAHHGSLKHYYKEPCNNGQRKTTYTIIFEKDRIRIALTRKKKDDTVVGKSKYYGIDVNVKHNLFCDKNGNTINFDRKIFDNYVNWLRNLDAKMKRKIGTKLAKRDLQSRKNWVVRIKDMLKRKSNLLVKQAISLGMDHIVMEDLGSMAKSYLRSEEFNGFKYSRLIRLLNLADLKNIVSSIANKHGLQVTFVQPHYTSQMCSCGHIDRENRKTQEKFKCAACGLEANADTHSAKNIEERMSVDVLRSRLLNLDARGLYTPKRVSKDAIRKLLEECYDINGSARPDRGIKIGKIV